MNLLFIAPYMRQQSEENRKKTAHHVHAMRAMRANRFSGAQLMINRPIVKYTCFCCGCCCYRPFMESRSFACVQFFFRIRYIFNALSNNGYVAVYAENHNSPTTTICSHQSSGGEGYEDGDRWQQKKLVRTTYSSTSTELMLTSKKKI